MFTDLDAAAEEFDDGTDNVASSVSATPRRHDDEAGTSATTADSEEE